MARTVSFLWKNFLYLYFCRILLLIYIVIPVIVKLFPTVLLRAIFSRGSSTHTSFSSPEIDWDLPQAKNHYIKSSNGNTIGVWDVPPLYGTVKHNKFKKYILYCHGKGGNRVTGHRTNFYKSLSEQGFHVVAFDYSGFGDSSGAPDGTSVTEDTVSVYEWMLKEIVVEHQNEDSVIIIWGHSLGSGIAAAAVHKLSQNPDAFHPHGVVLESTFPNLILASKYSRIYKLFSILYPYIYKKLYRTFLTKNDLLFDNENTLPRIKSHVIMLHSEDDPKIGVKLSQRLYDSVILNPNSTLPYFGYYRFHSRHLLGHNDIYSFINLRQILDDFIHTVRNQDITKKVRYEQIYA